MLDNRVTRLRASVLVLLEIMDTHACATFVIWHSEPRWKMQVRIADGKHVHYLVSASRLHESPVN